MRSEKLSNFIEWSILIFPFVGLFLFWGFQAAFNKSPKESLKEKTLIEQIPIRTKSMYVATTKGLRLREAPNLESKNIITISNGELVTILESENTIQIINDAPTLCKRERSNLCFGIGEAVEINGLYGRWTEVHWKEYTGYAFDGYLMEEDDFLLKKAIEEKRSISLPLFRIYGSGVLQEYRDTLFKVAIQKELENDKYRVITISPAKHNRCRDLSFRCFSIILNKKNDILFFDPENFGEVLAINDKSIIFYYSWIWEESYGDVYHAVRLSDWQVFGKEKRFGLRGNLY